MASNAVNNRHFFSYLIAGGFAGTTVDLSLYPVDTIKTRLQSAQGFRAAGGFRGVYAGVGSAVVGSAPGAALFFIVYEGTKSLITDLQSRKFVTTSSLVPTDDSINHMIAASLGEVAACAVRVPTEVVKQRAQALQHPSSLSAFVAILRRHSNHVFTATLSDLYRGWNVTILREVPFTMIQFPLWEALKKRKRGETRKDYDTTTSSAMFGAISGAIAAAATTPLDVLKTRIMLSYESQKITQLTAQLWQESGIRGFFSGWIPRACWISAGGAIFLGSYQFALNNLSTREPSQQSQIT